MSINQSKLSQEWTELPVVDSPVPSDHLSSPLDSPESGQFVIVSVQPLRYIVLPLEPTTGKAGEYMTALKDCVSVVDSRVADKVADGAKGEWTEADCRRTTVVADIDSALSPLSEGTTCYMAASRSWTYATKVDQVGVLRADGKDQLVELFQDFVMKL